MPIELREGIVLAGRLRLEHCIGQGGMGTVWAATHTMMQRRVAVKLLKGDNESDPEVRRRFLREGRAASAVRHPNVVEILDVLELEDGTPGIVMELLLGESLGQRLRRERRLSLADLSAVVLPTISAVGTAHAQGIIHRDLKPDNIFLATGAEGQTVVKVLDFGIAKIITIEGDPAQSEALTGTGAMLGTPHYMAPEQIFSDVSIDFRCDVWALGVILYEGLAGRRPARGNNFADIVKTIATNSIVPLEKVADVPPEVASLVGRMLSVDKEKRPQSLREVKEVLQCYTDVLATTFGNPVVSTLLDSSSRARSGLRMSDAALFGGPDDDRTATEGAATLNGPSTLLDTQHNLGVTFAGARSSRRKRFAYVGLGLGVALAALGARQWTQRAATATSAETIVAPETVATTSALPPPPAVETLPSASAARAPSGREPGQPHTPSVAVGSTTAAPRWPPPPARASALTPASAPTTTATTPPTRGAIVEKPPF